MAMSMFLTILCNTGHPEREIAAALEVFEFEDFKRFLDDWMKSMKMIWYICGNIRPEESTKMVEDVIEKLKLESPPEVKDLSATHIAKLRAQEVSCVREEITKKKMSILALWYTIKAHTTTQKIIKTTRTNF
jgi:secreted Zn-dependent insulinase-like peptidase